MECSPHSKRPSGASNLTSSGVTVASSSSANPTQAQTEVSSSSRSSYEPRRPGKISPILCQYCWKRSGPELRMFRCTGCKIDVYCSKECQKAAWPYHKQNCQAGQRLHSERPETSREFFQLRKFYSKHNSTIIVTGVHALNLHNDPSQYKLKVLVVDVEPRPTRIGRDPFDFYVTDVTVEPITCFGPENSNMMLKDLDLTEDRRRDKDGNPLGAFYAVFKCPSGLVTCAPFTYTKSLYKKNKDPPWKELLLETLNKGMSR